MYLINIMSSLHMYITLNINIIKLCIVIYVTYITYVTHFICYTFSSSFASL